MLEGIIYCKEKEIENELLKNTFNNNLINAKILSKKNDLEKHLLQNHTWFIIIAEKSTQNINYITEINNNYPHIYLIYYYPEFNVDNLHYSDFIRFSYIVIGEKRKEKLKEIFRVLSQTFWKKIPFEQVGITYNKLSPRLKDVMNYIETHDLKSSSTLKLSTYLRISQGYFSQEFRRETGQTFREFMQKLLAHYEKIIFEQLDLTAKQASEILGYSELASFSRAFKKRKGYPPSQQKIHQMFN
ncbi:helix-turn-helix domain-containing protein [Calditrichota bacterium]